ncbi:hypothetical protein VTJ04DRAFT_6981 [Mycothermus thermophilus]
MSTRYSQPKKGKSSSGTSSRGKTSEYALSHTLSLFGGPAAAGFS